MLLVGHPVIMVGRQGILFHCGEFLWPSGKFEISRRCFDFVINEKHVVGENILFFVLLDFQVRLFTKSLVSHFNKIEAPT